MIILIDQIVMFIWREDKIKIYLLFKKYIFQIVIKCIIYIKIGNKFYTNLI